MRSWRGAADVYERGGTYYIHGDAVTTKRMHATAEPFLALADSVSDDELGATVLEVIAATRFDVPHPSPAEERHLIDPLLRLAGVRSYRAFTQGARYVSISALEGRCRVYPSHYKARQGLLFAGEEEWVVLDDPPAPAALGAAIRVALERSTPPPTPAPRGGG